jgi:hypothetical protein
VRDSISTEPISLGVVALLLSGGILRDAAILQASR